MGRWLFHRPRTRYVVDGCCVHPSGHRPARMGVESKWPIIQYGVDNMRFSIVRLEERIAPGAMGGFYGNCNGSGKGSHKKSHKGSHKKGSHKGKGHCPPPPCPPKPCGW